MNSNEERAVDALPRLKSVSAARAPWTLNVTWADGTKDRVDLTGLIYRSRHFRVFLDDPAAFRRVHLADFGGGEKDRVDLTGLIYRSRHFRVFLDDAAA